MKLVNSEFIEYLNRYCKSRNVTEEEAMKHITVNEVRRYYIEKNFTIKYDSEGKPIPREVLIPDSIY